MYSCAVRIVSWVLDAIAKTITCISGFLFTKRRYVSDGLWLPDLPSTQRSATTQMCLVFV